MNKAKEIITAYINLVTGDELVKQLAKERMDVCSTCPHKKEMLGVDICGLCHCPLMAKAHSSINSCPVNKWLK
jgi:hypothetical protein